jgi:hypothetical protein
MRALLTSAGIKNSSINDALVDLLGKPVAESTALFIPTAAYPFPGGPGMAYRAICGKGPAPGASGPPRRFLGQRGEMGGPDSRADVCDR